MKQEISHDPFMRYCCIDDSCCEGRIEWHHVWIYDKNQINEVWAIVPACKYHHDKAESKEFKPLFQIASLRRATEDDLKKYPKKDWDQIISYLSTVA